MPRIGTKAYAEQKAACRAVLEGYPKTEKFTALSDIRMYLQAERITCLLCGKAYKALVAHISKVHGVSADKYKEQFGLPYRTGLSSDDTRGKNRANGYKHLVPVSDKGRAIVDRDRLRHAVQHQRTSVAKVLQSRKNVSLSPPPVSPFTEEHGFAILKSMRDHGTSLRVAVKSSGIMEMTAFAALLQRYPAVEAEYLQTRLTIHKGKANPLIHREEVVEEVRQLYAAGVSRAVIAKKLNIHPEYVTLLRRGYR